MIQVGAAFVLAAVLVASSALKLAGPASSRAALGTFGINGDRTRWIAWGTLIATELALAGGVALRSDVAAYLAAGLMLMFAALLAGAILRGKVGAPCACFGSRSRVGWTAVLRNLVLAGAFGALPLLPSKDLTTDEWLTVGLAAALVLCLGLGIAVLALAREVGMLRLRLGPGSALEIPEEGPAVGGRVDAEVFARFSTDPPTDLALAVFVSDGCPVCGTLKPAIDSLGREPWLSLQVFDEHADGDVWEKLEIPGSPFATAMDLDGTVLAKGTFNNLAQLESVLGTGARRRSEAAVV